MDSECEVIDLYQFLECAIPPGVRMLNYSLKQIDTPAKDYGIVCRNAEVVIQSNGKNVTEHMNVLIKSRTKSERIYSIFPGGLETEIAYFEYILPACKQFVVDQGGCRLLDFFPKFYGARHSLQSEAVDESATLLLENVEADDFQATDSDFGFSFESTKNIMTNLAIFHAVPIAFKCINCQKFDAEILPHLHRKNIYKNTSQKSESELLDIVIQAAKLSDEGEDLLPKVVKAVSDNLLYFSTKTPETKRERFETIIHNNLSLTSVVTKFKDDVPLENKFTSFNTIEYGSLARDVVFVLLSSVNMDVLKVSYLEFITIYYNIFISVLMELNCDTRQFTLELLHEEINLVASTMEFFHLLVMIGQLYGLPKEIELNEDTEVDYLLQFEINERCLKRMHDVIIFFGKKCWI